MFLIDPLGLCMERSGNFPSTRVVLQIKGRIIEASGSDNCWKFFSRADARSSRQKFVPRSDINRKIFGKRDKSVLGACCGFELRFKAVFYVVSSVLLKLTSPNSNA